MTADVSAMVTKLGLPAKEIVAVTGYVVRVVYTLLLLLSYRDFTIEVE